MDEIGDEIIQSKWYLFPVKMRKVLPTIVLNTQKPVEIKFFGNVSCTRQQFLKVSFYPSNRQILGTNCKKI